MASLLHTVSQCAITANNNNHAPAAPLHGLPNLAIPYRLEQRCKLCSPRVRYAGKGIKVDIKEWLCVDAVLTAVQQANLEIKQVSLKLVQEMLSFVLVSIISADLLQSALGSVTQGPVHLPSYCLVDLM